MSSEIVRRFREVSGEPYEGYQQAVFRVYGHLQEFQLYRDLSESASHIEALEAVVADLLEQVVDDAVYIDGIRGSCRGREEMVSSGEMPDAFYAAKALSQAKE